MKYLYLLGSVLRSWFTVQRKFTLSAILLFFFSSFLMLFAASATGNEEFGTVESEESALKSYVIHTDNGELAVSEVIFSETILDSLYSSASNSVKRLEANFEILADKMGNMVNVEIALMPVLKKDYGENIWCIMKMGNKGRCDFYHSGQNITEGQEISSKDLEDENKVVVLPEEYGVEVGDSITLFGEEFTVIGITSDDYGRIACSFIEKAALENEPEHESRMCNIFYFELDEPMTDETYESLNKAVFETMGKEIGYCRTFSTSGDNVQYTTYMTILGSVIALFSIFGIYYPTLKLCKETMPMLFVFKLCGMRTLPSFGLLFISVFICLAASFGLTSVVMIICEAVFAKALPVFELRKIYFEVSAIVFIFVAVIAMFPPLIKLAKSQPAEEVEN